MPTLDGFSSQQLLLFAFLHYKRKERKKKNDNSTFISYVRLISQICPVLSNFVASNKHVLSVDKGSRSFLIRKQSACLNCVALWKRRYFMSLEASMWILNNVESSKKLRAAGNCKYSFFIDNNKENINESEVLTEKT